MNRVGILTGLEAERRIIERAISGTPHILACAAAEASRAEREAAALIAAGAQALLSFGLAAGLDPAVRAGDVLCPDRVIVAEGETRATDPAWREAVVATASSAGIAMTAGGLAAVDRVIATAAEKRTLWESTGVRAADMESGATARAAAKAGLPHIVIRAVADPAERDLLAWTRSVVRADGRIALPVVTMHLARRPWDVAALVGVARDARVAFRSLRRVAGLGAALFAAA